MHTEYLHFVYQAINSLQEQGMVLRYHQVAYIVKLMKELIFADMTAIGWTENVCI